MIKAAIYCRLSDEDRNKRRKEDESESIQNQKSLLLEYCKEQNWRVAGVYCDEDMSGADRNRPQFNQMLEDCQKGLIDVVLCKTQSRFSRDIEVVEHYIHNLFREWGVRFVGLLDHADTEDFANKKSRQINGLVNEWYLEDLSENIKKTLRHKKENGIYTGAFAPYGYRLDNVQRGKLLVDEPAAKVVRQIFQRYLDGYGYMKIAKELNLKNVPCPSAYKRLQGSKFQTNGGKSTSNIWNESIIRQILTNRVYHGDLVQGKTTTISYKNKKRKHIKEEDYIVVEHTHDAIVERAVWEAVSNMIGSRRRTEKATGERHLFAGKIFCAECGSSMWKMSYRLKDGRYAYLKCKATKCSSTVCSNTPSIRFDVVFDVVQREIRNLLEQYFDNEKVDKDMLLATEQTESVYTKEQIEERILKQNLNIKQLYKDKLDGIIDYEIYCSVYQDIKAEIAFLRNQLSAIAEQLKPVHIAEVEQRIVEFKDRYIPDASAVSRLIDKIYIGQPQGDCRRITIVWKL